ncbi:MAG: hypothetical protein J6Y37_14385 [Paludibacteraceae bacterium]|nr:hypothetical protein [Paludibacteraceae bacterium]
MRIECSELSCGGDGALVQCENLARFLCPFCPEFRLGFPFVMDVSPFELRDLIDRGRFVIRLLT